MLVILFSCVFIFSIHFILLHTTPHLLLKRQPIALLRLPWRTACHTRRNGRCDRTPERLHVKIVVPQIGGPGIKKNQQIVFGETRELEVRMLLNLRSSTEEVQADQTLPHGRIWNPLHGSSQRSFFGLVLDFQGVIYFLGMIDLHIHSLRNAMWVIQTHKSCITYMYIYICILNIYVYTRPFQ